ncbi:MAG TPA: LemA family protein [Acidimicrobiales bacterium]|nr:LemA family protein [Acidimicrobiales bacterium]
MNMIWVVLGVVAVLFVLAAMSYNRFVTQKALMANSWANVDTELRRRHDLVPNLVETVQGYAGHEQHVLVDVARARTAARSTGGTGAEHNKEEGALSDALHSLFALAEAYPELEASAHFLDLQRQLVTTEDRIQAARRLYNADVRDYNRRVSSFPSMLVARLGGYEHADYFELEPSLRGSVPDVKA